MLTIDHIETFGWEAAVRGMRNPMNSWHLSDSDFSDPGHWEIGEKDRALMRKLVAAGSDHRKFLRMIGVSMDITAPLYWWKEYDTYKVGTVADSCSTMHKIAAKEFALEDFSHEHLTAVSLCQLTQTIHTLNFFRDRFNGPDGDKTDWWQMIQLLPSSYNQKRTVTLNYEVIRNMYHARKDHKQDEWRVFCKTMKDFLPLADLLITDEEMSK